MEKPVDRFARLFDPIEDIPGVVHEVMQLRATTRARCLSGRDVRSQRDSVELHLRCRSFPGELTSAQTLAVVYAELLSVVLLMWFSPPAGFFWLIVGPWTVDAVANEVLFARASCSDRTLRVAVTKDALRFEFGSELARRESAQFHSVLLREFRGPRNVKKSMVALARAGHSVVPISGWMDLDSAYDLGKAVSQALDLPLTAEYAKVRYVVEPGFHGQRGYRGLDFSSYRHFAPDKDSESVKAAPILWPFPTSR